MLETLKNFLFPPEPKVGDVLIDKIWGDYNTIEVVRVSEDKKEILYMFLKVKGKKADSSTAYSGTWKVLLMDSYKIIKLK